MNNKVVLLVDDSADDVELTLRSFKKHNLANKVVVARNGQEALDYLFGEGSESHYPKVILLDLKLPKVDGLEVLRRIKSAPALKNIPVVVLTSSREERDLAQSYELGVNSYVVKPVNFEDFAEAVRKLGLYWLLLNQPPVLKAINESR